MPIHRKVNKNFFKKWTREMAYVLGFLYADGNLMRSKRGGYYIALYSSDRPLLETMKKYMDSGHKVSLRGATSGQVYRIQIGSKEWFFDLEKIGLRPNKSKRLHLPKIPDAYFGDFIRGYFDGDGNVWVGYVHRERNVPLKVIQVAFTCGSHEYLRSLHKALKKKGLTGGSLYASKSKNFSRLAFSIGDAMKLYKIMYNTSHKLYLKRKKVVFEQFMNCGRSSTG